MPRTPQAGSLKPAPTTRKSDSSASTLQTSTTPSTPVPQRHRNRPVDDVIPTPIPSKKAKVAPPPAVIEEQSIEEDEDEYAYDSDDELNSAGYMAKSGKVLQTLCTKCGVIKENKPLVVSFSSLICYNTFIIFVGLYWQKLSPQYASKLHLDLTRSRGSILELEIQLAVGADFL